MTEQVEPSPQTLAEKLDHLFRTVKPLGREFTHQEVAERLRDGDGPTISATYVWQLRRGQRTNPRMSHLEALARVFEVAPAYFFPGELGARMGAELETVQALRDPGTRRLAHVVDRLTPGSRRLLDEVSEHLLVLEGRAQA